MAEEKVSDGGAAKSAEGCAREAVESKSSCDWWSEATSGSLKEHKLWEKREGKALSCLRNEMAEAVEEAEEQDMRGL